MPSGVSGTHRTELLAALSIAIDLGLGQPVEHVLRSSIIATRLADRLGVSSAQREAAFYTTLVMWIGCHAESHEYVRWFGDDISVKQQAYLVDWTGVPYMRFLMGNVAHGSPLPQRLKVIAQLMRNPKRHLGSLVLSHCTSASLLAGQIGLPPEVQTALAATFERYDGQGGPEGITGDAIPIEMRIAQLADLVEVHDRTYGPGGAEHLVRSRRGGHFDPAVADAFLGDPDAFLAPPASGDYWREVIESSPERRPMTGVELDRMLVAIGDFADLKCPFTLGHSRAVADLAARAAASLGLGEEDVTAVRRAGHVHDIGRIGISNRIWEQEAPLTADQWERVRLHPYLSGRILGRVAGLETVARIAANHHEQPSGSGYPQGLPLAALPLPDCVLAAAVAYESALEPRPYRPALSLDEAASRLRERAQASEIDNAAVNAVLEVAGHRPLKAARADGLTPREAEILVYVAKGESNKAIAARLTLSEKTVRNHVERVYAKIGVNNRIGASMYALSHELVSPGR